MKKIYCLVVFSFVFWGVYAQEEWFSGTVPDRGPIGGTDRGDTDKPQYRKRRFGRCCSVH
ncbi:hypothetical protein FACS189445_1340 [Spirochaetia bacterium]|nr:hypothetical protein FACS189445_1340 [Spirochaetia bacterium]